MYTAMLTVENMVGEAQHDVWTVNTDFDYLEEMRSAPGGATGMVGETGAVAAGS